MRTSAEIKTYKEALALLPNFAALCGWLVAFTFGCCALSPVLSRQIEYAVADTCALADTATRLIASLF